MKNSLAFILLFCITLSCKKDKKNEPPNIQQLPSEVEYPNYSNLKIGNYWIYERFINYENGSSTSLAIIDSCYIENDTVIRGNKYYKYVEPNFGKTGSPTNSQSPLISKYYRDSMNYLITSLGEIEFAFNVYDKIFYTNFGINTPNDTIYRLEHKMGDENLTITINSNSYVTSSFKEIFYMYPNYRNGGTVRTKNTRYAKDIGKVTQEWYFYVNTTDKWERRLIRYKVN